ncbi:MAG: AlpA family phage regulatory protein [Sideroxydans sp.]|nr:AlpA family phage regulatory protein [Sideroxydans sp.]
MVQKMQTTHPSGSSQKSDANHSIPQTKYSNKTGRSIPLEIENFDSLPRSAFVREPVVLALLSCSKSSLWRWVKSSRVPSPVKLGMRTTAWQVGELRTYLENLGTSAAGNLTGEQGK